MIIEISSKNLAISPGSRKLIAAYNLDLKRYFKKIFSVRWSFETVRKSIEAHLLVHAYSGQYRAKVLGTTIREVLIGACDIVEKQRRRRKRMTERLRRRTIRKPMRSPGFSSTGHEMTTSEDFGL